MKRSIVWVCTPVLSLTALLPLSAQAHPGHELAGALAGALHPLGGLDHWLAMVAVGLWAGSLGDRGRWMLPLGFVATMVAAALVGMAALSPPPLWLEPGIAGTVAALGLLLLAARRPAAVQRWALVAVCGALHGWAHGVELPAAATAGAYIAGFAVTTVVLQGVGVFAGIYLVAARPGQSLLRWSGAALAVAGAWLMLQ